MTSRASNAQDTDAAYRSESARVFVITWIAYATSYLGRKGLSVAKARLVTEVGLSTGALNTIDTAFLTAYAAGQFVSGYIGDRWGGRRLVGLGLLGAAATCAWFGSANGALAFVLAFGFSGAAQSAGWPGNNRVIAQWTTPADRGKVMGLWSTCYQVGGFVATAWATRLLVSFGWRAVFYVPAAVMLVVGIAVFAFLPEARTRDGDPQHVAQQVAQQRADRRELLKDATVWRYSAAYFSIKLIRYSLLFWLPFYLHTALRYSEGSAGYLSTALEVGGVVGSVGFGWLSDRHPRIPRARIVGWGLVGLAVAFLVYLWLAPHGTVANAAGIGLIGFALFGPDALLSGTATQELGGKHNASTAVGIVNGVGSAGAILQGTLTDQVSRRWGWPMLFRVLLVLAVVSAVLLLVSSRKRSAR